MRCSDVMKKFLIIFLAAIILFSGCVDQKTVKSGDTVSIDYILKLQDGKVFDTSIESVAKENNIYNSNRSYKPYQFTVGKNDTIKGIDEGVIGMKVGDTKPLEIPPEKGYGNIDPNLIHAIPIIQDIPATRNYSKVTEIPADQFKRTFGQEPKVGDTVVYPETNIHFTIQNITSNVSMFFNQTVGYNIWFSGAAWNETIVKIDDKNVTTKPDVKKNEIIQLQGAAWNSSVIDVNNENITLRHNAIPDTTIQNMFEVVRVHFNETSVILDRNPELAGKTLMFNVTLRSINESKK